MRSVGSPGQERYVEALQFAASLRGAKNLDEAILWCLQHGYMLEREIGDHMTYWLTDAGRTYAGDVLAANKSIGSTRWLLPVLGLGVSAWILGKVIRR